MSDENFPIPHKKNYLNQEENSNDFTLETALQEFEELKKIALNCFDKNGNPNIGAAMRAVENKAKIAGLYSKTKQKANIVTNMTDIKLDGEQLKLEIGEEIIDENP